MLTGDQFGLSATPVGIHTSMLYLGGLLYACAIVILVRTYVVWINPCSYQATRRMRCKRRRRGAVIGDGRCVLVSSYIGLSLASLIHNLR